MIRRTVRSIIKWAMDDSQQQKINYSNQLTISTIGGGDVIGRDEEDRSIRRPGIMFTVYPAEGGTVIQCKSNKHGEMTKNAYSHPRLYVIHDDDTFNNELANIIHMERVRTL